MPEITLTMISALLVFGLNVITFIRLFTSKREEAIQKFTEIEIRLSACEKTLKELNELSDDILSLKIEIAKLSTKIDKM